MILENQIEPTFATLPEALRRAKTDEDESGAERYVMLTVVPEGYTVVAGMPLLGRWWSTDGVRHG